MIVGDTALFRREESRSEPDAVGAQHERGGDRPAVGDTSRRDDRHGRDGVHDGRNQWQRRDPTGMTARFGSLGRNDVDARRSRAACVVCRSHLTHDERARVVGLRDERSRVREGVGDDANARL